MAFAEIIDKSLVNNKSDHQPSILFGKDGIIYMLTELVEYAFGRHKDIRSLIA